MAFSKRTNGERNSPAIALLHFILVLLTLDIGEITFYKKMVMTAFIV